MKKEDCLQCKDLPEGYVVVGHDHRQKEEITFDIDDNVFGPRMIEVEFSRPIEEDEFKPGTMLMKPSRVMKAILCPEQFWGHGRGCDCEVCSTYLEIRDEQKAKYLELTGEEYVESE